MQLLALSGEPAFLKLWIHFRQNFLHFHDGKLSVKSRFCQRNADILPVLCHNFCDRFSKEFDYSAICFCKAEHQPDRRAFSGSVFSNQSGDSSLRNLHRKLKIKSRIHLSDILHFYHVCLFLSAAAPAFLIFPPEEGLLSPEYPPGSFPSQGHGRWLFQNPPLLLSALPPARAVCRKPLHTFPFRESL